MSHACPRAIAQSMDSRPDGRRTLFRIVLSSLPYIREDRRCCAMRNIRVYSQLSCLVNGNALHRLFHRPGNACFQGKRWAIRDGICDLHLPGSTGRDFNRVDACILHRPIIPFGCGFLRRTCDRQKRIEANQAEQCSCIDIFHDVGFSCCRRIPNQGKA